MRTKSVSVLISLYCLAAVAVTEYRGLPQAYVQVDSISSTGGQYIDTGVVAGPDVSAVLDFTPLAYTGDVNIGTNTDDNKDWRFFNYGGGSMFDIGNQRIGFNGDTVLQNGTRYTVSIGNSYYPLLNEDGSLKWSGTGGVMGAAQINAHNIFVCANNNGGGASSHVAMSIHSLVMSNSVNGVAQCVRDFVPCYRVSDNEPGLYDLVSGTFFADPGQNATKFGVGSQVLPSDKPMALMSAMGRTWDTLSWSGTLTYVGAGATTADVYFALGTDPDNLPAATRVQQGLGLDGTISILATDLDLGTTYHYSLYLTNDQGHDSDPIIGSFTTLTENDHALKSGDGVVSFSSLYVNHTFAQAGTHAFTPDTDILVDLLVVGGGGAGGWMTILNRIFSVDAPSMRAASIASSGT